MATRIQSWQIVDGKLVPLEVTLAAAGRTEPLDLETWIESDPSIIGPELVLIGRQVSTRSGPLDLLAIDRSGNLVIVELKRDLLAREAMTQAIDYASDIATWSIDKVAEVCATYTGKNLDELLEETFPDIDLESININETQRILLVGFSIESSLERMITWLSSSYGVSINAVILHYIKTDTGEELLTKTAVISEEVEQDRIKRRKIHIPMSDEPGKYELEELREHLMRYLALDYKTIKLTRHTILPILLERESITRQELLQELVDRGAADSLTAAGQTLTGISRQLGMAKYDYLRQIIGYDYPTYSWEKDNYKIQEGYKEFVQELLAELDKPE